MRMPYCSECTIGEGDGRARAMSARQRTARAIVGIGWLALARAFLNIPFPALAWPLSTAGAWLGASHLIASLTAYPDCPELGAIPSLVGRRYISSRCGPWERLDRWLEPRS